MNILVTGCNGQLGNEMQLLEKLHPEHTYYNTDVQELDITDQEAIEAFVEENKMTASWTAPPTPPWTRPRTTKTCDIKSNDAKIQIYVNRKNHKGQKSFEETHNQIRRGDFIGVIGNPGRTNPKDKEGELSVSATDVIQLSYCLHMLPKEESGLKETETRFRQRYLEHLIPKTNNTIP